MNTEFQTGASSGKTTTAQQNEDVASAYTELEPGTPKLSLLQGADRMLAMNGGSTAQIQATAGDANGEIVIDVAASDFPPDVNFDDLETVIFSYDEQTQLTTPTFIFRTPVEAGGQSIASELPNSIGANAGRSSSETKTVTTSPTSTTRLQAGLVVNIKLGGINISINGKLDHTQDSGRTQITKVERTSSGGSTGGGGGSGQSSRARGPAKTPLLPCPPKH